MSGDENCRARTDSESDDRAVFGTQVAKNGLDLGERLEQPLKTGDDGDGGWSRRELVGRLKEGEEGVEEQTKG